MYDLTRLKQMFHETSINPTTTKHDTPPLIQANVPTPRVSPRQNATTAPQEIKPSPRMPNVPIFEEEHANPPAHNTRSMKPTITQEYVLRIVTFLVFASRIRLTIK